MAYMIIASFDNRNFPWKWFRRRIIIIFILICCNFSFLFEFSVLAEGKGNKPQQQCFEKQFTNLVVNFGSLHVIKRIGVVAPPEGFYLAYFIDVNTAEQRNKYKIENENGQHLAKMSNGDKLILYSSHSAHSLEWTQPDILATVLRLESVSNLIQLGTNISSQLNTPTTTISPNVLVTACAAHNLKPIEISNSFTVRPSLLGIASAAYENELIINFKTFENGLFFYSMANHGDHLVVQLSSGRAEVYFDFGANQRVVLSGGFALNDGEWHEMRWVHRFDGVELFVDAVRVNSTEIGGLYRKLDLHSEIEIGGRPEEINDEQVTELMNLENGFHGCLARFILNGVDLLATASLEWKECQVPHPQLFSLGASTSLQIPYTFLPFAFDFHVLSGSGPLLTILDNENSSLLQIKIVEQKADKKESELIILEDLLPRRTVSISTGLDGENPKIFSLGPGWHSLVLKLRTDSLDLILNGKTVFWVQGNQARQIGTRMQTFLLSASGCYRSTTIDLNQGIPIGTEYQHDQCSLIQRCSPNPCQNGGKCVQSDFYKFQCECPRNYRGRFCHISELPSSCEQNFAITATNRGSSYRANGMKNKENKKQTHLLMIDLDGGGPLKPFNIECRKIVSLMKETPNDKIEFGTILHNDAPKAGIQVRGLSDPGAVRRILDYGLGSEELEYFISSFEHCEQRMRFQCSGDQRLMTYSGEDRRPSVWYATRNGQQGFQWGDAPPFSRMCSCALNSSCLLNHQCNCDSGESAEDEGINFHIQLLPILQLFIGGGTNSHSLANISIGPLECTGRYVSETISFTDRNQRLFTSFNSHNSKTFHVSINVKLTHPRLTIFTYASSNQERWFQLAVRDGLIIGQIVNAGIITELVSDLHVNDNRWHFVNWEVDEQAQFLRVDHTEKILNGFFVLPRASILIIGSRTYVPDRSGFAGQLRHFILNGEPVRLEQLAKKALGTGIQLGEWSACAGGMSGGKAKEQTVTNKCQNGGRCVELYDGFKCNCSLTPFAGDTCEEEVGMWLSIGSELRIAWQHPGQVSNCFRMNVHTVSNGPLSLIRAHALFAESRFNLSIDREDHLVAFIFDGFFFTQNVTYDKILMSDNKSKDIRFCANSSGFFLTVNGEAAFSLSGNFTFFSSLNVWHFADQHRFKGCISRLMVGDAFPLKNPRESRLLHSGKIRFGSCPFDKIDHSQMKGNQLNSIGFLNADDYEEINLSSFVKSQRRLLFITPAIGLMTALCILLSLFIILIYIQRRPDGVYKTNEKSLVSFAPVPPLIPIISDFEREKSIPSTSTSKKFKENCNNRNDVICDKFAECESLNAVTQSHEFFC